MDVILWINKLMCGAALMIYLGWTMLCSVVLRKMAGHKNLSLWLLISLFYNFQSFMASHTFPCIVMVKIPLKYI